MRETDLRHYNRASKRWLNLQMVYWCWYKGLELPAGKIDDVFYGGNSVYGSVYVKINNQWYKVSYPRSAYRPRKEDIYKPLLPANNETIETIIKNKMDSI